MRNLHWRCKSKKDVIKGTAEKNKKINDDPIAMTLVEVCEGGALFGGQGV